MRANYVLIDYENVQPTEFLILDHENFYVRLFLGVNQNKIPFEVAVALQKMGTRAEYIKSCKKGSNALDFYIAFYVGQIATQEPDAYFHIISSDTGFDSLIQHLRDKKILAQRFSCIKDIPVLRSLSASSLNERVDVIKTRFNQPRITLPRTIKTLSNTIYHTFAKNLSSEEVIDIIRELHKQNFIVLKENKIEYNRSASY
ncbi:hypothetical protein CJ255_05360 [Candidatus Viridilinea mediisalina]|uniref:PIN-like domain-containing protein n=2 Tax=Candidatus Viridilinea mediisalina TaxID=2024553 RepID=A0A2A6RMJ1_9CHLR|nr:hypothetical protein CJ255_05360 [Candidatus Viridilinea mediisalina]